MGFSSRSFWAIGLSRCPRGSEKHLETAILVSTKVAFPWFVSHKTPLRKQQAE